MECTDDEAMPISSEPLAVCNGLKASFSYRKCFFRTSTQVANVPNDKPKRQLESRRVRKVPFGGKRGIRKAAASPSSL